MGVVSFFGGLRAKKPSAVTLTSAIASTEQALTVVFRDIASEKNQMLYPTQTHTMSHAEHRANVVSSAKNLILSIDTLIFASQDKPLVPALLDLTTAAELLEKSILAYQENDHVLSQLLLACSSIKINLEKFRSDL